MALAGEHCPCVILEPSQPDIGGHRPLEGLGPPMIGEIDDGDEVETHVLANRDRGRIVPLGLHMSSGLYFDENREFTLRYKLWITHVLTQMADTKGSATHLKRLAGTYSTGNKRLVLSLMAAKAFPRA